MSDASLATAVRELLREHIDSYEKLDALLLLRRQQEPLALNGIANALELSRRSAREVISQLIASGLVIEDPPDCFEYRPRFAGLRDAVEGLARIYEEEPLQVVQWMSRNAFDRLRRSAAGAFAEALLTGTKKRP